MSETENKSRFAELALEILGAKTGAELLRDIWEQAPAERKRELADAVMAAAGEAIKRGNNLRWPVETILAKRVQEVMETFMVEREAEIVLEVRTVMEAALPAIIDGALQNTGEALRKKLAAMLNVDRW